MGRLNQIARLVTSLAGPIINKATRSFRLNNGLTVFLFHEVTDNPSEFLKSTGMWVSTEVFRAQTDWILRNFQVISIKDLSTKQSLPRNSAVITFDDCWAGMVQAIENYLLPREVPICLFLNFGTIAEGVDVVAAERFLNYDRREFNSAVSELFTELDSLQEQKYKEFLEFQGPIVEHVSIQRLSENRKVTIASHSFHHFDATRLSDEEFLSDFVQNDRWIQSFKDCGSSDFYAFPFGTPGLNFEERHLMLLYDQGVRFCFSGTSHRLRKFQTSQRVIPRIHFSPEDRTSGNMWWACYKNQILRR